MCAQPGLGSMNFGGKLNEVRMLRVFSASGEELAALDAETAAAKGSTVGALKRYLVEKCLETSRFQVKILRGDECELSDDESIVPPVDLHVVLMNHLAPDEERDGKFLESCRDGLAEDVEQRLTALQDPNVIAFSAQDGFPLPGLGLATRRGHLKVAKLLLEAGAEIHPPDIATTPLGDAAEANELELARLLLEFGAIQKPPTENFGKTPLCLASENGHVDMVRLLLDSRGDPEVHFRDGMGPLHFAAQWGFADVLRLLIDSKANIEAEDEDLNRPLHFAAQNGRLEAVQVLVDAGANRMAKTEEGETAFEIAAFSGERAIAVLVAPVGMPKQEVEALLDQIDGAED